MDQRENFENRLSGPGDKQPERVVNEPRAPEGTLLRQVQDTKESLSVLKSQVSFANQCFNLLQNQMKHAADTLNILQDQINVAQRTVNNLTEGGDAQQHIITHHQSAAALAGIGSYQVPSSRVPCVAGPMEEQRVIVHDSEGPKIYTLSKSSISLGNQSVLAAEGGMVKEHCPGLCVAQPIPVHCHCSACLSHASLQHLSPQFHAQSQGLPRTSVHQVSPEVLLSQPTCTSPRQLGRDGVAAVQPNMPGPPAHVPVSPECAKEGSDSRKTAVKSESASSSPMAHQLLQVIDVLQTADDDDGCSNKSAVISSSSLSSHAHGSYAIKGNAPAYETGTAVQHRPSRRNRKQNISPLKLSAQSSAQQDIKSPVKSSASRECLDLMRVPAPVLASTLEPEFLVVPTSSFSYDSPPASATGGDAVGKNVKLSPDSRSVATVVSSTAAASEVTAGSNVVSSQNSSPYATRSLSTQPKCADVQDVCRVARDSGKEFDLEGGRGGNCSFNSGVKTLPPSSFGSGIDEGRSPLSPGPKRRLTGTSPLNSEVRMPPFMGYTSAEHGAESMLTRTNSAAEPTQSCSAVVSNTEHSSSVAVSSSNHVSSQGRQMAVISLPNSTESSVGNSQRTVTPPTKKPIILSRRTSRGEQNIPQGLVVLVPTIEDAKRLIATSGSNAQGRTPVLVPQHMLNEINSKNADADETLEQQLIRKRNYDLVSPPRTLSSKRPAVDSVVID